MVMHWADQVDTRLCLGKHDRVTSARGVLAMLGGAVLLMGVLGGCAGDDSVVVPTPDPSTAGTPSAPPTPTPTPTPEIVTWAGSVCVARDELFATVGEIAMNLDYDPNSPQSVGEQFQAQVEAQMDKVDAASRKLGTALGGVPLDYIEAAAALTAIQAKVDVLTAARDKTMGHVNAAQDAGDPVSAGLEWFKAAGAAKEALDAGTETLDALSQARGAVDGDVEDAFAKAPECQ